jgi:hypothetical protein
MPTLVLPTMMIRQSIARQSKSKRKTRQRHGSRTGKLPKRPLQTQSNPRQCNLSLKEKKSQHKTASLIVCNRKTWHGDSFQHSDWLLCQHSTSAERNQLGQQEIWQHPLTASPIQIPPYSYSNQSPKPNKQPNQTQLDQPSC